MLEWIGRQVEMRTWAFVSQKGGAGKSTLCVNLAVYAEQAGETVLLVDLDPQMSAYAWFEVRESKNPHVIASEAKDLDEIIKAADVFKASLVMIDTAPHADNEAASAVAVADLVICPTRASLFDIAALKDTAAIIRAADAEARSIAVVNAIPDDKPDAVFAEAALALDGLGFKPLDAFVCQRQTYVRATNTGKGVTEIAPKALASKEIIKLWQSLNQLSPIQQKAKKRERA